MPTTEYKFTADARQAQAEVDKLTAAEQRATKQAHEMGRAMDSATKPTRNTGMAFLDLSRAVEDAQYGLRGIQNNIPGIVMSLGGGAGLTGGISLAVIALTQLYEHFGKVPDVAGEAMKATIARVGELRDELSKAQEDVDALFYGADLAGQRSIDERLKKAQASAKKAFEPFGGEAAYRASGFLVNASGIIEHTIDEMFGEAGERGAKRITEDMVAAAAAAAEEISTLTALQEQRGAAQALREFNRAETEKKRETERAAKQAEADAEAAIKRVAKSLEDSFSAAVKRGLSTGMMTSISDAMNAQVQRGGFGIGAEMRQQALDAITDEDLLSQPPSIFGDRGDNFIPDLQKEVNGIMLTEQEQWAKQMAGTFNVIGDAAYAAFTSPMDAIGMLVDATAQAAGDAVTFEGAKSLAGGLAAASNPLTAAAAPSQIAAGIGLIAAGQAIRVGGAAAVGALQGAGSSPSAARSDPGAAPRRSSGSTGSGSGDLVVTVSYGVAGPLPEDTARAIAAAVRTGDRRRGGGGR